MKDIYSVVFSAIFLLSLPSVSHSRIINVPGDFGTIQAGINNAENGDTVLVQPGTYRENVRFTQQFIVVGSLFLTTGDEGFIERTVIDGDHNGGSVIVFRIGEVGLLTGFTIQNGETDYGGGIYIRNSNPVLSHLIVSDNVVERNGGGIYCTEFSSPTISNVVIRNNSCGYVGGGFGGYGNSTPTLTNCQIYDNYSDHVGGGVHGYRSELTLNRVTISHNRALHTGGAIYLTQDAVANLSECILWENEPHEIQLAFGENVTQINVYHSDVDGGLEGVEMWNMGEANWVVGNIDQDPQFTDPDAGDYHLQGDSPCIDAGNPESDPDPDGTITDMGALYFHNEGGRYALHVPDDFDSISEAVDASDDGDIVLVQPGEYTENINFNGKNITIGSRFLSTDNEEFIEQTVIDGNEEGSVVTFENGETEYAILIGFLLTNGRAESGGGIHIRGASPVIQNVVISQNRAGHNGGGIFCSDNSNPLINGCIITGNYAVDAGGGLLIANDSDPTISYSLITVNSTDGNGGGIYCSSRVSPMFYCCTATGNDADDFGGGIWCENNSHPAIANSIFWNNEPQEVYFNRNREPNSISLAYSDLTGGIDAIIVNDNGEIEWNDGNIDEDPLFADPDNDNFHLTENSPCIDAGDPGSPLDPDDTRADMGAYYFHHVIERNPVIIHIPDDYETIQTAINMAQPGDTILVRPGTYIENLNFRGVNITLASLFLTTGDPAYIDSTTIDGDGNDVVVKFSRRETSSTRLIGFTIRNGSHPEGGGIYCYNSSPTIRHCAIYGNEAEEGGGGVFCYASSPRFYNCTIADNSVEAGGGGMFLWSSSYIYLYNTIIYDNSPVQIYYGSDRDPNGINVYYSDIAGGEDDIVDNFNGNISWRDGNIDEDPLFADGDNHDYRLTEDSPCIDAGDPDSPQDIDHTRTDMGAFFYCENLNPILLESGWNMISSYVDPPDDDVWVVWSGSVDRRNLIIVRDYLGRFFWPRFNYNNIPGWDVRYGYQVKMVRSDRLYIAGEPVSEDEPIELAEGWSIVAYYPEQAVPVQEAMSNISDQLVFVKDGKGHFHVPEYGFSNMEALHRGQGYQVNVSEAVELTWNVPDRMASKDYLLRTHSAPIHYTPVAPTGSNMSLLILDLDVCNNGKRSAQGEFEVGVFIDNGLCVGAGVANRNDPFGIVVWGDDPTTEVIDGALKNTRLSFRLWNGSCEAGLEAEWIEGDGIYVTDGLAVVSYRAQSTLPLSFGLGNAYPNPFNSLTNISYQLPEPSEVTIRIYDIQGREIVTLVNDRIEAGYYNAVWNAVEFPSGLYICRMKASDYVRSIKITLIK